MEEINKSYYAIIPAVVRYDEDLPPNAKLLYGEITALCNEKGYCWANNSYFAELYKVTKRSIANWIDLLSQKGYITTEINYKKGTKEILNRHIKISSIPYGKFFHYPSEKFFTTPSEKNFMDNNTVINNTENKYIYVQEFDSLWSKYPRKEGRPQAWNHYKSARSKGVSYDDINKALDNYIEYIKQNKIERKFIKMGSTWFNGHWEDEYDVKTKPKLPDYDWGEVL